MNKTDQDEQRLASISKKMLAMPPKPREDSKRDKSTAKRNKNPTKKRVAKKRG